ncbi:MAG TPA: SMC-Scp complex subunit ScpB [Mycobacteriales bacterium]|nr:SMC-Scp complex subunit ScpB [Mycobacteriales bacterium]
MTDENPPQPPPAVWPDPSDRRPEADITDGEAPTPAPTAAPDEATGTPPLRRILESILLVVDEPVAEVLLAQVTESPRAAIAEELAALAQAYRAEGRGFELRRVGEGWRLYTAEDCAPYVERFVLDGQHARLTQAALETLAVIAYRQPVSRQSIASIRGVSVDGVVRTLIGRGLISEISADPSTGAHLYGTTAYFLERLGLGSLDELPSLAPLLPQDIDEFDADL